MDLSTLHVTHDIHDLDLDVIHSFLASAYWSVDIPKETVWQAIQHSLCTGLFFNGQQIGFARAITDYATFAYIADVFILAPYRGQGLSKPLLSALFDQLDRLNLRRVLLMTSDAQGVYRQFGFSELSHPDHAMEKFNPTVYRQM